jgi:serine/threonine protein kinase
MSSGIYNGRVIAHSSTDRSLQGLMRVEEIQSPIDCPIAIYISRFSSYSEKDCRAICLQIAQCINIMHNAGLAHRNLHLGNLVIDPFVRKAVWKFINMFISFINQPLTAGCFVFLGQSQYKRFTLCSTYSGQPTTNWTFWFSVQLVRFQSTGGR